MYRILGFFVNMYQQSNFSHFHMELLCLQQGARGVSEGSGLPAGEHSVYGSRGV